MTCITEGSIAENIFTHQYLYFHLFVPIFFTYLTYFGMHDAVHQNLYTKRTMSKIAKHRLLYTKTTFYDDIFIHNVYLSESDFQVELCLKIAKLKFILIQSGFHYKIKWLPGYHEDLLSLIKITQDVTMRRQI